MTTPSSISGLSNPPRDADNPRQPAQIAFHKAVAGGADPAALIEAARRYALAVAGRERPFVASAARWLGEGRWIDGKAETPPVAPVGVWISAGSPEWQA